MSDAFVWDAHTRAFWRDQARMHPHGIATTLAGLSDLLDAAEKRGAQEDPRLARVKALHRPGQWGGLVCTHCHDRNGQPVPWPCDTAEALSGRSEP